MKVTTSPLVSALSGKAGDVVAATWKGRQYARRRVTPANPNSAGQQTVRESMGRLAPLWRSLSAAVKAVQNAYAASYRMSGWNWFAKQNRVLEETNLAGVLTPPNTALDPVTDLALADAGAGSCTVTWTNPGHGAGYYVSIWSRKIESGEIDAAFTLESEGTVLASAETASITLEASKDFQVIVAVEEDSTDDYSECVADQITMGA